MAISAMGLPAAIHTNPVAFLWCCFNLLLIFLPMTRSLTVAALEKLIPIVLCWKCSGCNTLFTAAVGGRLVSGSLAFGLRHQLSAGKTVWGPLAQMLSHEQLLLWTVINGARLKLLLTTG